MNQFSSSIRYYILAILFLLLSCEDRVLLKKDAELNLHIKDLKKQIESLQADAGENPGDQSQMLDAAKAEKKNLENQKKILERDHAKLESQYSNYKKSYPIKKWGGISAQN